MEIVKFTEFILKGIDKDGNTIVFKQAEDATINAYAYMCDGEIQFTIKLRQNQSGIMMNVLKDEESLKNRVITEEEFAQILIE